MEILGVEGNAGEQGSNPSSWDTNICLSGRKYIFLSVKSDDVLKTFHDHPEKY